MQLGRDMRGGVSMVSMFGLVLVGCSHDLVLDLKFSTEGIDRATTHLEAFLFEVPEGQEGQICGRLDPHGAPALDAPKRSGLTPAFEQRGGRAPEIAHFGPIEGGTWAVALDAYGPPCLRESSSADHKETLCAEFAPGEPTVLRAHGCALVRGESLGTSTFDLRATAPIGSRMSGDVALAYNTQDPLAVVEGLPAHDELIVQLVDDRAEDANGVAVNWSVVEGSGSIEGEAPRETGPAVFDSPAQNRVEDEGISSAIVRAGVTASEIAGGSIRVAAHAPGFEGSPFVFQARAVRGVELSWDTFVFAAALDDLEPRFHPVVVDDLDGDGRAEVFFARAEGTRATARHRIVVLEQDGEAGWRSRVSAPFPGEASALAAVRRSASGERALVVFSVAAQAMVGDVPPFGSHNHVVDPTVQVFTLEDGELVAGSSTIAVELPCPTGDCAPVSMTKMVVSADPGDLDGDGADELAVSRCSFADYGPLECFAPSSTGSNYDNDSEAAVLRFEGQGTDLAVRRVSAFQARDLTGFRRRGTINEVRFADLNGDRRLDLAFSQALLTNGVCGNGQVATGYGLTSPGANPFDTSTTIDSGYSIAVGHFTDDDKDDVITGGGLRAAGGFSGLKLLPSEDCKFGAGANELNVGPPAAARDLAFRARDLNQDGYTDVAALHLEQGELRTFFGSGTRQLARGPTIFFGARHLASLGVGADGSDKKATILATYDPANGRAFIVRLRARP